MDEGDGEDVAAVSRPEDIRSQVKEDEFSLESRHLLESRERMFSREADQPRSSIQQFVDMLGGKDPITEVNVVGMSGNPCSSYEGNAEERAQELTIGRYNAGNSMMNEDEMMENILNEWQNENQLRPGSLHEHPINKASCPTASRTLVDSRSAYGLAGEASDQNANVGSGHSTYSDAVLRNTLPPEGMRMKIISKSSGSGFPEYFVKNTLKGKGFVHRGPISAPGEFTDQNTAKAAAAHTTSSDPFINVREKSATLSTDEADLSPSQHSVNHGASLRDWMKSGQRELHKVDSLLIFKKILDMVYSLHSEGKILVDLRPSCFSLLPSKEVKYCGRMSLQTELHGSIKQKNVQKSQALKRPLEQGMSPCFNSKHQKFTDMNFQKLKPQIHLGYGFKPLTNSIVASFAGPGDSGCEREYQPDADCKMWGHSNRLLLPSSVQHTPAGDQLEEKWYRSPELVVGRTWSFSSNIYGLGVLLFELLSSFESGRVHVAAMSDLRHRILPPNFLSENPKEAGFCLWLLHPEPSLRPTASDVLQSEVVSGFRALCADDKPSSSSSIQQDEDESELLSHFLMSMKEHKEKHALKLVENLGWIEADIKELSKRHLPKKSSGLTCLQEDFLYATEKGFPHGADGFFNPVSDLRDSRFLKNVAQLENAYFSMRSQIQVSSSDSLIRQDKDVLKNRENWCSDQADEGQTRSVDSPGDFFDGLCKYARYSKLEVIGTVRNRDITNSTNVICSLSFDRDEDYFAAAGVSKKIKIFEFQTLCDNSVDIHYPVIEMSNRSKLSSVCWNTYIRNYLASTDYDGTVKLWDASTGQGFSQYNEHEKRAWSVDFSRLDPTKFASGSDDFSVKLWSINERNCLHTIRNRANVCCVQFSAHSSHLLSFGSADYKIYCYDLRNSNVPWCILAGHEKAVSYVKFVDSETLVSASTDNTLKLWDLKRSSCIGLPDTGCRLTLSGHTNEKNFVGLSAANGYITCGSETNEVYTYYNSLPMPITSHKFGSIDPISGRETDDDSGQFVSSVCWKGNSNVLVAANSNGCIKALQMI